MKIEEELIRDEGLRLSLYPDSVGKWTIGVGRNIEDRGIHADEAILMLKNDIIDARESAEKFEWYHELSDDRKKVIINMIFNLGETKFRQFKKMIAALEREDYESAADEMLDSRWAYQVGPRATRLVKRMRG